MKRSRQRKNVPRHELQRVKLIVSGDAGTGKSSLISTFLQPDLGPAELAMLFPTGYEPTIGVDFVLGSVTLPGGTTAHVNFWDLSGHDEFASVRQELYKPNGGSGSSSEKQGLLLVFDVTDRCSFRKLDFWLEEATKFGAIVDAQTVLVCGNKCDQSLEDRQVSTVEAAEWAASHSYVYMETSAKRNINVQDACLHLIHGLFSLSESPVPPASSSYANRENQQSQDNKGTPSQPQTIPQPGATGSSSTAASPVLVDISKMTPEYVSTMSVKEMKALLSNWGASSANCLTKSDLIAKVTQVLDKVKQQREEGQALHRKKEEEKIRDHVFELVQRWLSGKDVRALLNSVHGNGVTPPTPPPDSPTASKLEPTASLSQVTKSYKRALLRIHPDKADQADFEAHLRATETFKAVNAAFLRFKAAQERRSSSRK